MGKVKEAQEAYYETILLNPSSWKACFRLGWILVKLGDIKTGIDQLHKARSINMKNNEIKLRLAEAYLMDDEVSSQVQRNVSQAIKILKDVMQHQPKNYNA